MPIALTCTNLTSTSLCSSYHTRITPVNDDQALIVIGHIVSNTSVGRDETTRPHPSTRLAMPASIASLSASAMKSSVNRKASVFKKPSHLDPLPASANSPRQSISATDNNNSLGAFKTPSPAADKQSLCLDLLMRGYVNSYVDLFYLTHRHDNQTTAHNNSGSTDQQHRSSVFTAPSARSSSISRTSRSSSTAANPASSGSRPSTVVIPSSSLPFLSQQLSTAEHYHRLAQPSPIFTAYTALSHYFTQLHDYKTAVYFQDKTLELADNLCAAAAGSGGAAGMGRVYLPVIVQSLAELGSLYESMDQPKAAIAHFERCGRVAREMTAAGLATESETAVIDKARQQLVHAYMRYASEHERAGEWQEAVRFYGKCIRDAKEVDDKSSEMASLYHIALIDIVTGQHEAALPHLQAALSLARTLSAHLEPSILVTLASVYEHLNELSLSIQYLEDAYLVSTQQRDDSRQCEVMARLGEVYSRQGEYKEGMRMFEKCYEVCRKAGDRTGMDVARINVGKSRGNVFMQQFMQLVGGGEEDMRTLIQWKTKRQGLKLAA